nr:response regulator [Lysobacter sp. GX 14042]
MVDDQPARLLTYRSILEPLGEELVEARSGVEALERLMEDEFAVILLDVNMPGMDGFETASMIHQHPRFERTPIIFVTAVNVTDMDRLRGYKLGAVDYVMVPVITEILRGKVSVLVELYRKRRELQAANAALEQANQALQARQERELEVLNASLRSANAALGAQNVELHGEIAERRRVEQLLRTADRRKDEFLATLAHELRNPLAPLQNALSIRRLSQDAGDGQLQATMERQLALLVRLIDDLLDIARISQGKLALRRAPTSLRAVAEAAIELARPVLDVGGHALQLVLPDEPVLLVADHARLSQVFANLLNNAAKYSDPGSPVQLRASAGPVADTIRVEVVDSGIGLDPTQTEHIFDMFSQVDASADRAQGGLGVGLTLVRHLVDLHGGAIGVSSAGPGQGATFEVVLPVAAGPVPAPPAPAAACPCTSRPQRRVLVVDDNHDAADTLAMMVEMLGHDVRRLYDPHEVLEQARAFQPDLVFLDVGMPGLSGYTLAPELRALPGGEALEIVAVTGWGQPEDRRRTREAGFDRHLVKPPPLDEIEQLCNRPRRQTATEQAGG